MLPSSTSLSADSVINRRRIVADANEKAGPSRHSSNGVVTLETQEDQEPIRYFVFSMFSIFRFLFIFNLFKFYLNQRRRNPVAKSPSSDSIGSGNPYPEIHGNQSLPYTLQWINGKKNFECKTCKKTFSYESNINSHLRLHTGERPFKCEICEKRFTQMHHLKNHIRIHTGKQFSCQVCGKSFTQSSSRNTHMMRIHTGEKFPCDICQKEFITKSNLKLHKRVHNNERPYKCGGCQKKYVSASRLRRHWKRSKCEPSSVDELSLSDSNDSDVEGNHYICQTISMAKSKLKNFSKTNKRLCATGMGDSEEEMSDTQQQNDGSQSRKGKSLAPTNSKMSQFIHSRVGAHRRRLIEDEEETSSESSSFSHSEESSSDDDEESNRYFLFVLHFIRFLFIYIFVYVTQRELSEAKESVKDCVLEKGRIPRPMSTL